MKRIWLFLLLLAWGPALHAEVVRLTVTKQQKKNYRTTSTSAYGSRQQSGTETYTYTIEVANRSAAALNSLRIKWAVVVRQYSQEQLVAGERTGSVALGQKLTLETDPIELSVSRYDSAYGYSSRTGAEVVGYSVRVYDGEKLIAEENVPGGLGVKVDQLRAAEEKKPRRF